MVGNLYADDAARIAKMPKGTKAQRLAIDAAKKQAEDQVIAQAKMFKLDIKKIGDKMIGEERVGYIQVSQDADAIAKREIIKDRIHMEFFSQNKQDLFLEYIKKDMAEVMDWAKDHKISLREFMNKPELKDLFKAPKPLQDLYEKQIFEWGPGAKSNFDMYEYNQFVKWIYKHVDDAVLDRMPGLQEFEVLKYKRDVTRAYYMDSQLKIMVDTHDKVGVMVHEFGHFIQHSNAQIDNVLKYYFKERTAGSQLERLYPYIKKNTEMAYKGVFYDDYMGKVYATGGGQQQNAVELLSMSLQKMAENPQTFALKDPELFQMTIGIMAGLL